MKQSDKLFDDIVSFKNLLLASKKARKGKRYKHSTASFEINLENELLLLQKELIEGRYKPGKYKEFYIFEPKKRMISAAPYRDRVVHHALCNTIEPLYECSFIYDSYANRKNKGTHKAIVRYQKYSKLNKYVLKCDIKKYFPSIDHELLKNTIRKKIICAKTLKLIELIIDNSNIQEDIFEYFPDDDLFTPYERRHGLPIGNLTSQFFANIYLDPFDHFIKEKLKIKHYIRYVDDFLICGNNKNELNVVKNLIREYFVSLRLTLNGNKTMIHKTENGIEFLGHKVFPQFRLLKRSNAINFIRRLKKMKRLHELKMMDIEKAKKSIQSWDAHASFSNTFRLRKKIYSKYAFY